MSASSAPAGRCRAHHPQPAAPRAALGVGEMKAGHGRHPQTGGTTPRALPSGPEPHPDEHKEPEQEFVPGLVSRQGFVIPALSGMCSAHGKLPDLRISGGTWHLAPGPGARLPRTSRTLRDAPCPPCIPRSCAPHRHLPGFSRYLCLVTALREPGTFQPCCSRGGRSGMAARGVTDRLPGAPAPLRAQPCQGIWEDFRPFCVFPKRRK